VAATFLLSDAKDTEITFELMNNEGAFTRLVDLIASPNSDAKPGLHRLFMELFYEMARVQRVKIGELGMSLHLILSTPTPRTVVRPLPMLTLLLLSAR
jgi:hypothetical protein